MPSFCQRKIKSGAALFSMNSEQHLASWKAALHTSSVGSPRTLWRAQVWLLCGEINHQMSEAGSSC